MGCPADAMAKSSDLLPILWLVNQKFDSIQVD